MHPRFTGGGLTVPQLIAAQAGLDAIGLPDAKVIIADNFELKVKEISGLATYSTGRGANVVAAKTIPTGDDSIIVVNGPVVRDRAPDAIERLLAHEAGHVMLNSRNEGARGRQHLAASEPDWYLMCIGSNALDELRIERVLAGLGYPVAEAGAIDDLDNAMYYLNCEIVEAVVDPASADLETFRDAVLRTHDWLSKNLALVAAYHEGTSGPDLAGLSDIARENWLDYIGGHWAIRAAYYESVPDAAAPMSDSALRRVLLDGAQVEADLLRSLGFSYTAAAGGGWAFRRTGSDALFDSRVKRALAETEARDAAAS